VKLAEAPSETSVAARERPEDSAAPASSMSYDKIGVRVEPVSSNPALASRLTEDQRGVRVVEVDPRGPARGQLFQDDIITAVQFPRPRTEVRSVADLQSVLSKLKQGDVVSLLVYDAQRRATRVANISVGGQ
jgi:S1-C subfamily serine protease